MAKKIRRQKSVEKRTVVEESVKKEKLPKIALKFSKKMFLYVFILLIIVGLVYFSAKSLLVASVNGQLVSRLTIVRELEKQGGKKTLDTVILKILINQEAKKKKIDVSQKEVDGELLKIESNVTAQGTTLDALLQQQGMTKEDLANEIKIQLLVTKMVDKNITVTDKEADDYLASQKTQSSLNVSQTTPELTQDQAKQAIKQQKLQQKIQTFIADLKAKAKINYFLKY
jgi:foldase protein PrsA